MKNYKYNAEFLEQWFEQSGMSQAQLMNTLGVNNISLKRWMRDKTNPLPVEKMITLCNAFDIDLSEFFLEGEETATIVPKTSTDYSETVKHRAPATIKSSENETILRMQIEHLKEIQRIQQESRDREETIRREYQQREDQIRKDYEERIEKIQDMLRESMDTARIALLHEDHSGGYGEKNYGVAEYKKQQRT